MWRTFLLPLWGIFMVCLAAETKKAQSINFGLPSTLGLADSPFMVPRTASSGLPVTFRVISGPGFIEGNLLYLTNRGGLSLQGEQGGNEEFEPVNKTQNFQVIPSPQAIEWTWPSLDRLALNRPTELHARVSSGLPVNFRVLNGPGIITGRTLTVTNDGYLTVRAEAGTNHLYAAFSGNRVFNARTPELEVRLKWEWPFANPVEDIEVEGGIAYLAGRNRIVDLSNPASPFEVASYGLFQANKVVTESGYSYLHSRGKELIIYDVRDPSQPVQTAYLYGSGGTNATAFDVRGELLYLGIPNKMAIVNLGEERTNHLVMGVYDFQGVPTQINIHGNTGVVVTGQNGIHVVDLSNPGAPRQIGYLASTGTQSEAAWNDGMLYVADAAQGVIIYRMGVTTEMEVAGRFDLSGGAKHIKAEGSRAYVSTMTSGFIILDVSAPGAPKLTGAYDPHGEAGAFDLEDAIVYLVNSEKGVEAIDVSQPNAPVMRGIYRNEGTTTQVVLKGKHALVADGIAGVQVMDMTMPSRPMHVANYREWANGIALVGEFAFVAGGEMGLIVLDASDPLNLSRIGGVDLPGKATTVRVRDGVAYVAAKEGGFHCVDISNPAQPTVLASIEMSQALDTILEGSRAYVVDEWSGVRVVDISNPMAPRELGIFTGFEPHLAAVKGPILYVMKGDQGSIDSTLYMVNVADPAKPEVLRQDRLMRKSTGEMLRWAEGIAVIGNNLFISVVGGFLTYDVTYPENPRLLNDTTPIRHGQLSVIGDHLFVGRKTFGFEIIKVDWPEDRPLMTVDAMATGVRIAWPKRFSDWKLHFNRSPSTNSWQEVGEPAFAQGDDLMVEVPADTDIFFRLVKEAAPLTGTDL